MSDSWEEYGARAEWHRRRQVLALLAIIIIVAGIWLFPRHRPGGEPVRVQPGYQDAGRVIDTSPFEPVGPDATSTLVDPVLESILRDTTTTAPPTSTTAPPTTTTTLPIPVLADESSITSLCGISASLQSLLGIQGEPNAKPIAEKALANIDQYLKVAPPENRADVNALRSDMRRIASILEANGWDGTDGHFERAINAIVQDKAPFEGVLDRYVRIAFAEGRLCRDSPG